MIGEDLLQEINDTLDCLTRNAQAMQQGKLPKASYEKEIYEKTQESLLARLIHLDQRWESHPKELKKTKSPSPHFSIQKKWLDLQKTQEKSFLTLSHKMGVFSLQRVKRKKIPSKKQTTL